MPRPTTAIEHHPQSRRSSDCDFCDEFAGGVANGFHARYGASVPSRIILAGRSFRVFPSIGQLVPGYLLIAPIRHYTSVDQIPPEEFENLTDMWSPTRAILSEIYGRSIFFEHGARNPINGGCGIYHAHVHAVPIAGAKDPIDTLTSEFKFEEFEDLEGLRKRSQILPSYLLYQNSDKRLYLFDTGPLPSQYMRKLLADTLHQDNWDWRTAGREERLLATIERLTPRFAAMQRCIESHTNA